MSLWPVIAVLIAQLVTATPAHAQAQVEFIPSVSLFTVVDDNIFAGANGTAGQMLQLRPTFEGSYESPITRLLGLYSFDMQRSNFSSLTTLDARRHALGEAAVPHDPVHDARRGRQVRPQQHAGRYRLRHGGPRESAGTRNVSSSCRALSGGSVRERRCRAATTSFRSTSWTASAEPCTSGALA